jgi:hypothetical protein
MIPLSLIWVGCIESILYISSAKSKGNCVTKFGVNSYEMPEV